jgi:hypothetical protein
VANTPEDANSSIDDRDITSGQGTVGLSAPLVLRHRWSCGTVDL